MTDQRRHKRDQAVDQNLAEEYEALCKWLNCSQEQAQQEAATWATFVRDSTDPENPWDVVIPCPPGDTGALADAVRKVGAQAADGQLAIGPKEASTLEYLVNCPTEWRCVHPTADRRWAPTTEAESLCYGDLVQAARGLWRVLDGQARLLRCPAPTLGHSDPAKKCGHYFVSGGKIGRPAKFCSNACAKRDSRVKKKVAEWQR